MTDFLPSLKALAEASIAAGEFKPTATWSEDRGYSPAEVAWLEFAAQATPQAVLELIFDARRYHWLRDSSESIHQFYLSTPIWFTGVKFSKDNVDSTIDAAMAAGVQP